MFGGVSHCVLVYDKFHRCTENAVSTIAHCDLRSEQSQKLEFDALREGSWKLDRDICST